MSESSSIIVCNRRYDVGRRVINFKDDPSISAYTPSCVTRAGLFPSQPARGIDPQQVMRFRPRRLLGADRTLERLQQVLRQFVVHHDGMGSSRDCFRVLHDERGLSVHFLIDNNGDIYQTLDLVDCAFQAAGVNEIAIGVELCNRGDALQFPDFYRGGERDKRTCTINRHEFLAWDYTKAQYEAMTDLGRALARLFPGLPQAVPQDPSGEPFWDTLPNPRGYAGYLGHYHVTTNKWDPGPWDFKRFIHTIRGRTFFPALPGRAPAELPDDEARRGELSDELYDNNEKEGEGGYFPVGPFGETRLWHGGSHLRDERGREVVAPFEGRVVAARLKPESDWPAVGSMNFVLLRHDLSVGGVAVRFFTLLFHLDEEADPGRQPAWLRRGRSRPWGAELDAGEVVLPDEAVGAGEVVGHFGEAGKPGRWQGHLHVELFAEEEITGKIGDDDGFWTRIDGARSGRFCAAPEVVGPIDTNRSGTLARSEVTAFFQSNPAREKFHHLAVRHLSEWGDRNDWEAALHRSKDFAGLSKLARHRLFTEQIEPSLWWTEKLDGTGLPRDLVVWGYHPIALIGWLSDKMRGKPQADVAIRDEKSFGGKPPPSNIKDDGDATEGFLDDEDLLFGEGSKHLELEQLSDGYPEK